MKRALDCQVGACRDLRVVCYLLSETEDRTQCTKFFDQAL